MSLLQQEAQSLNPAAVITLFTMDARNVGGAVYRFCGETEPDGSAIMFGGNTYPQLSLKYEGFEWNSDGSLPRPKISISALNETFYNLVISTSGAQGSLIQRDRTLARFLDGHEDGGQNIKFPSDLYIVDRITTLTKKLIVLELLTPLDLPRCEVPARMALRDLCPWVYRRWDSSLGAWEYDQTGNACPYAGSNRYTKYGISTNNNSEDACGRKMSDCVLRYGTNKDLPYGGFPGLARTRA